MLQMFCKPKSYVSCVYLSIFCHYSTMVQSVAVNLAYLPYLNLFWTVLSLAFQFVALSAMSYLLYCAWSKGPQLKTSSLSSSMKIYLTYHIFFCIFCLPYHAPVFMKFIPATSNIVLGPYLTYSIEIPVGLYYYINPIPLFFLSLDRCFVLLAPLYYTKRFQKNYLYAVIFTMISINIAYLAVFLVTPQTEEDKARCSPAECFMLKYRALIQNHIRLAVGIANVFCACFFIRAIRIGNNNSLKNRIVKVTLLMEVIFNVNLSIVTSLFIQLTGNIPYTYLGHYPLVPITFDAAVCSLYYLQVLLKRRKSLDVQRKEETELNMAILSSKAHGT